MNNRIKDKIDEIEKYLEELYEIVPADLSLYMGDFKIRAACERYFEKIVEAVVDLSFVVVKLMGFSPPEEEGNVFDLLAQENIISKDLGDKLRSAKGMRNFIIHQYERIDDELVFEVLRETFENDMKNFVNAIRGLEI